MINKLSRALKARLLARFSSRRATSSSTSPAPPNEGLPETAGRAGMYRVLQTSAPGEPFDNSWVPPVIDRQPHFLIQLVRGEAVVASWMAQKPLEPSLGTQTIVLALTARLPNDFDLDAVALREVVRSALADDGPVFRTHRTLSNSLEVRVSRRDTPRADIDGTASRAARTVTRTPPDLSATPLFAVELLTNDGEVINSAWFASEHGHPPDDGGLRLVVESLCTRVPEEYKVEPGAVLEQVRSVLDRPGPLTASWEARMSTDVRLRIRRVGPYRARPLSSWIHGNRWLVSDEAGAVAAESAQTLDHALARLFLRLGPPPDSLSHDYVPTTSGDGGAKP